MAERVRIHIEDAPVKDIVLPEGMERETVVKVLQECGTLMAAGGKSFGGACTQNKANKVWQWFCKVACRYDMNYWTNTYLAYAQIQKPFIMKKDCIDEVLDKLVESRCRLKLAEERLDYIINGLTCARAAAQGKEDINQQNL